MLNKGEGLNSVFRDTKCILLFHSCIGLPPVCLDTEGKTSNINQLRLRRCLWREADAS